MRRDNGIKKTFCGNNWIFSLRLQCWTSKNHEYTDQRKKGKKIIENSFVSFDGALKLATALSLCSENPAAYLEDNFLKTQIYLCDIYLSVSALHHIFSKSITDNVQLVVITAVACREQNYN